MHFTKNSDNKRPLLASTGADKMLVDTPLLRNVPRIASIVLFGSTRELEIEHNGILYRLRQTSLGKLILTK